MVGTGWRTGSRLGGVLACGRESTFSETRGKKMKVRKEEEF